MNIKGFRRMLFGEKMPDKNDPKYKDRYEREVSAGRKFAQATRIDKAAAKVQGFANAHRILFLVIVFGFAIGGFTWNIYRIRASFVKRMRGMYPSASSGSFIVRVTCDLMSYVRTSTFEFGYPAFGYL